MEGRWNPNGFQFFSFLVLILGHKIQGSWSLNDEGSVLLEFRTTVSSDPFGAFANWNINDHDPCLWRGVHCVTGKVETLDLNGLSLEGTLSPVLGKLSHLKLLVLYKNHFYGTIPKEIGGLTKLEVLDLRENNFSGTVPAEIGRLPSLKCLLLCDNKFEGSNLLKVGRLNFLSELQFDEDLACGVVSGNDCINRKVRNGFKLGKDTLHECGDNSCDKLASSPGLHMVQNVEILVSSARRRLFELSSNLPAGPASGGSSSQQIIALPTTRSSGSFPAIPNAKKDPPPPPAPVAAPPVESPPKGFQSDSDVTPTNEQSSHTWIYFLIIPIVFALVIISLGLVLICRKRGVTTIGPWKTGLSGQLQKAFVTGVPKLNRTELETACEDFSNIIDTHEGCTMYKGTLSSGVEIAVASTLVASSKDWSKNAELSYRKKIDTLSRVNHKNFVNLIGFCEEDEPFNRMMVFEYAPNGTLFEHLHVKEMEHLDWSARMRIIMGTAYCLQYMHHDLNPPVAHSNLNSHSIYLTDDYAAKIAEVCFLPQPVRKSKISGDGESEHSELPPLTDPETNVYSFGILLLEIISGKLPYSKEQGPLEKWAAEYLNDKRSISYMIDPTLKAFKNNELDIICEVIQECIQPDPRQRPTMRDITSKLREVITISPDQATPRLSPLWWAELEILSVEAT
ncbi:protein MALE DISCOVERER 2 [Ricinus communis]|uniref:Receptor protein kinase, putative n=1 Tax=Ricinus communis TaxID=3988 RepID=B9T7R3_RICCO|nr:protein MALE DISCOVERER 2 [Ricinus communis]EEF28099.1 receptor protein kinase, putative [Ricinus communis]|eukprot:XP_002534282.1 protein MALE DISCOVERER 2 [Ricinus communis]